MQQAVSILYPVRSLASQTLSAGNSRLIFTTGNSKPIQRRALNLVPLDSLGSWESIYVYFKTINLEKHELNHFEDNRNTILDLFWSLTSEHEMARETH